MENRRLFIVIEGVDGVGKSVCAKLLAKMLHGYYYKTPSQPFSKIKREIDLSNNLNTRFIFYLASVIDASREIENLLKKRIVVCDRYVCSTIAYHQALHADISYVNLTKLPIFMPDFSFYLWADWKTRKKRIIKRGLKSVSDRKLEKDKTLQERIHRIFLSFPAFQINTSNLSPREVCEKISKEIQKKRT